jgi:hypothetical protein
MEPSKHRTFSINDFKQWYENGELILVPKFQRRSVWNPKARSFFIDTILRGKPVPPIFIRQSLDIHKGTTIREVVDGQQRLNAIFDYLKGGFTVQKFHNPSVGGLRFSELSEDERRSFLDYELSVALLTGATDSDVLDIFARINSFTIVLNEQEKRNAKYFGAFKNFVYSLGYEHLPFWKAEGILRDSRIARMGEAELTSELVVTMIDGLQNKKDKLNDFYKKYDEEFPEAEEVGTKFRHCMDIIGNIFQNRLKGTRFASVPLFYSLFCVFYDLLYGLKGYGGETLKIPIAKKEDIVATIDRLGNIIKEKSKAAKYHDFVDASIKATDNVAQRQIRHNVIKAELLKVLR